MFVQAFVLVANPRAESDHAVTADALGSSDRLQAPMGFG